MPNPQTEMTLDDAVDEVLGHLTGLDLSYSPEYDRYRAIARQLNRALRSMALEHEWSYYSDIEHAGDVQDGMTELYLRSSVRPRIVGDDSVRFVSKEDGQPFAWAYIVPRDALHKYLDRDGLRVSFTRNTVTFSRPLTGALVGQEIHIPVMREPRMFEIPKPPEGDDVALEPIDPDVRTQIVDFDFPDVVILRAAYYVAQSDPVMQPRVMSLEAQYKDLMYQLVERDQRHTDNPYLNEFELPIDGSLLGGGQYGRHRHPHADTRR